MSVESRGKLLLAAVLVAVGCVVACDGPGGDTTGPVVVALYTLSGSEASTGQDLRQGIELARDLVNGSFGLPLPMAASVGLPHHGGAPLRVVFADCRGDPAVAVDLVDRYAAEGVTAFVGCYSSALTEAASRRAETLGLPFLNTASTAPLLTRRGYRWFFRTTPDDAMFSAMLFDFLDGVGFGRHERTGAGHERGGVALVYENGLWGTGVSLEEMRQARRRGHAIVADMPYDSSALDADALAARLARVRPAVILQASYAADAVALVRAMHRAGVRPKGILGMDAGFIDPRFMAELGPWGEHILSREVFALDIASGKPVVGRVNALFRKRHDRDMTGNSARALTGLLVLAEALDRAESFRPEDVRRALLDTDIPAGMVPMPWDGVRFDPESGQNTLGRGIVVQVQDGAWRTVWPPDMAAANPFWPGAQKGGGRP